MEKQNSKILTEFMKRGAEIYGLAKCCSTMGLQNVALHRKVNIGINHDILSRNTKTNDLDPVHLIIFRHKSV